MVRMRGNTLNSKCTFHKSNKKIKLEMLGSSKGRILVCNSRRCWKIKVNELRAQVMDYFKSFPLWKLVLSTPFQQFN